LLSYYEFNLCHAVRQFERNGLCGISTYIHVISGFQVVIVAVLFYSIYSMNFHYWCNLSITPYFAAMFSVLKLSIGLLSQSVMYGIQLSNCNLESMVLLLYSVDL